MDTEVEMHLFFSCWFLCRFIPRRPLNLSMCSCSTVHQHFKPRSSQTTGYFPAKFIDKRGINSVASNGKKKCLNKSHGKFELLFITDFDLSRLVIKKRWTDNKFYHLHINTEQNYAKIRNLINCDNL